MIARRLPWLTALALVGCVTACTKKAVEESADASAPAASSGTALVEKPAVPTADTAVSSGPPDLEQQCERCAPGKCSMSDADACYQLALKVEAGDGVPQDANRARSLLQRASKAGHAKARQRLRKTWGL